MKKQKTGILIVLAAVSLVAIGAVAVRGFLRKVPTLLKEKTEVLGESVKDNISEGISSSVNSLFQKGVDEAKSTVSQKADDLGNQFVQRVEKEVSSLTQSQIQTLKTQICANWGVITVTVTPTPSPTP